MRSVKEILEEMLTHEPIFTAWTNTSKENVFEKYAIELSASYDREIGWYRRIADRAVNELKKLEDEIKQFNK